MGQKSHKLDRETLSWFKKRKIKEKLGKEEKEKKEEGKEGKLCNKVIMSITTAYTSMELFIKLPILKN